ncbi:hypothetical protein DDB_G0292628 [Dictyostelium discoideum AX4]|uniref:Uncharacterized protein n=1 Tax=Dictyostelium discoideum TaxID=44689 RepID=Q54CY7_DICDI|nr:hypothetical protein DDB_G0292628 [Dictyostelium discoideum AX4]EAL61117.1 hypothetical protein DDB_G0292628 [Dictyostelium discoideum AX4]|eukprot:XP_629533.1 hypothetical protein DDB_G0292628 [Dictyostelium discoideum AX4]
MVQNENKEFIILISVKIISIFLISFHLKIDSIVSPIVTKILSNLIIFFLGKFPFFKEENCIKHKNHIFYDLLLTLFHVILDIFSLEVKNFLNILTIGSQHIYAIFVDFKNLYNYKKEKEFDLCDYENLQIENQKLSKENIKKDKEIEELNLFLKSLVPKGILYVPLKKKKIKNEIFFEY